MTTDITLFEPQNFGLIVQSAPQAYKENTISHDRCIQFGQELLDRANTEGMSDALDQEIATFIERAKKTLKKMNGKRSAVTQIFDTIRSAYTGLENEVDPAKKGTVPAQLQEIRNAYAAHKRAEEERRRQEQLIRQRQNMARDRYAAECEAQLRDLVNRHLTYRIELIRKILAETTLANYNQAEERIKSVGEVLDQENMVFQMRQVCVVIQSEIPMQEKDNIRDTKARELLPQLASQFNIAINCEKEAAIQMLPSKRQELERIAKANADEAARIKAQMEERERKEAEQREKERAEREAKEKAAAQLQAQKQEMNTLFGAAEMQVNQYQPKTSVKKRINVLNPEGFMQIVGMWWAQYGCTLTVAELEKEFKKQLTYCNKLANDKQHPVFIQSEHIEYVDDVKAK